MSEKLPATIRVNELLSSRYDALYATGELERGSRPFSWDDRTEGIDVVRCEDGREIRLLSDGGQSPPHPGWVLVLRGGDADAGYSWTLYGMPSQAEMRG